MHREQQGCSSGSGRTSSSGPTRRCTGRAVIALRDHPTAASAMGINVALYKNVRYDPLRDFEPIMIAGQNALLLVTNPSFPPTTVKDFIALAKSKPTEISVGTSGIGTTAHLSLEQFNRLAGVKLTHIPYRGSSAAMPDPTLPVTMSAVRTGPSSRTMDTQTSRPT